MVIVAAVDRSGRAPVVVAEAQTLADTFDLPLHVVHVMTRSRFVELELDAVDQTREAISVDDIRNAARHHAEKATESSGEPYEAVGLVGDIDDRIVQYAEDNDARYIVVGPRNRSPTGKAVFGSIAQSILLNSPVPVVSILSNER